MLLFPSISFGPQMLGKGKMQIKQKKSEELKT
jgi:hypothetical protein